jgi:hypothetical protein
MDHNGQEKTTATTFPVATYQIKDLTWTFSFTLAAVIFPSILAHTPHNQWITGTIVNALLFLAVWRVGVVNSLLVAALPSSIALLRGLLPAPMAALIPFIILSNIILVAVFFRAKKHPVSGVVAASFLKFFFLYAVSLFFLETAGPLLFMMQWPQFVTALAGGLIAVGAIRIFYRAYL